MGASGNLLIWLEQPHDLKSRTLEQSVRPEATAMYLGWEADALHVAQTLIQSEPEEGCPPPYLIRNDIMSDMFISNCEGDDTLVTTLLLGSSQPLEDEYLQTQGLLGIFW